MCVQFMNPSQLHRLRILLLTVLPLIRHIIVLSLLHGGVEDIPHLAAAVAALLISQVVREVWPKRGAKVHDFAVGEALPAKHAPALLAHLFELPRHRPVRVDSRRGSADCNRLFDLPLRHGGAQDIPHLAAVVAAFLLSLLTRELSPKRVGKEHASAVPETLLAQCAPARGAILLELPRHRPGRVDRRPECAECRKPFGLPLLHGGAEDIPQLAAGIATDRLSHIVRRLWHIRWEG